MNATLSELVALSLSLRSEMFSPSDDDGEPNRFDEAVSAFAEVDAAIEEKVAAYRSVIFAAESDIEMVGCEIKRLQKRKAAAETRAESLESHLADMICAAGYERIENTLFTLTIKPKGRVVCTVPAKELPAEYVRVSESRAANLTALREAMEAGREVPAEFRPSLIWR